MNDFIIAKKLSEAASAAVKSARRKVKVYFTAGTTDLYVQIKDAGLIEEPNVFIDISRIPELKKISFEKNILTIGAGATFDEIIRNPLCAKHAPLLIKASEEIGSPLIRNRATIGGNIANSSPAGDSIPPLVALGATVVLRFGQSTRKILVEKFFTGPKKNILKNGEIIEKILIPKNDLNFYKFLKLGSRKALAISKISLAVAAKISKSAEISDIKISAGAVGPTVIRCLKTEQLLIKEKSLEQAAINKAKDTIYSEILPIDDFRSTADYRRAAAAALLEEALRAMISAAQN